jgi:hypothetical protein
MTWRLIVLCSALIATGAASASGQGSTAHPSGSAAPRPTTATRDTTTVTFGWEFRNDAHRYRFENASTFDTPRLVPHVFEQEYDADNQWIVARARYGLFGRRLESEAGLASWGTGVGRDFDTFFQPDGDTVVYGTMAVTSLHVFRVCQRIELGTLLGVAWRIGYVYRRDRSEFRPSDSVTRHSIPPSESRFFNTDRETTISAVHEAQFGVTRTVTGAGRWQLAAGVDLSPVTLARLTTILPDKYPGQEIVFIAKGLSLAPSLRFTVTRGVVAMGFSADYVHTWPYRSASRFTRNWLGVGAFVGWSARR